MTGSNLAHGVTTTIGGQDGLSIRPALRTLTPARFHANDTEKVIDVRLRDAESLCDARRFLPRRIATRNLMSGRDGLLGRDALSLDRLNFVSLKTGAHVMGAVADCLSNFWNGSALIRERDHPASLFLCEAVALVAVSTSKRRDAAGPQDLPDPLARDVMVGGDLFQRLSGQIAPSKDDFAIFLGSWWCAASALGTVHGCEQSGRGLEPFTLDAQISELPVQAPLDTKIAGHLSEQRHLGLEVDPELLATSLRINRAADLDRSDTIRAAEEIDATPAHDAFANSAALSGR